MSEKRGKKAPAPPSHGQTKLISGSGSPMDVALLENLVKLMAANDLNTIELREGDRRLILKRGPAGFISAPVSVQPAGVAVPAATPSPAAGGGSAQPAPANDESRLLQIKSPMPGTFYVAPKQGEKPFVSVGSVVDEQTDVCIIEAMKVFNNLPAGVSGTIQRICVEDGQPVEFGTILFLVKPN